MNVVMLGISSDLGQSLAAEFRSRGHQVWGTRRSVSSNDSGARDIYPLDLSAAAPFDALESRLGPTVKDAGGWDVLIDLIGDLRPIGPFLDLDPAQWKRSVEINALAPLEVLQRLWKFRRPNCEVHAVFFAGGGVSGSAPNYSAYTISKIILTKMCEVLHDEQENLNPFILGPGWVRTKIHEQTLEAGEAAGANLKRTHQFLETGIREIGPGQVFACLEWAIKQGKSVVGGRNISVEHDPWNDPSEDLAQKLGRSPELFKLRRRES